MTTYTNYVKPAKEVDTRVKAGNVFTAFMHQEDVDPVIAKAIGSSKGHDILSVKQTFPTWLLKQPKSRTFGSANHAFYQFLYATRRISVNAKGERDN